MQRVAVVGRQDAHFDVAADQLADAHPHHRHFRRVGPHLAAPHQLAQLGFPSRARPLHHPAPALDVDPPRRRQPDVVHRLRQPLAHVIGHVDRA